MIHNARNNQCGSSIEHTNFSEWVSLAVATNALTHGILKLMVKINASPSAWVKFADRI